MYPPPRADDRAGRPGRRLLRDPRRLDEVHLRQERHRRHGVRTIEPPTPPLMHDSTPRTSAPCSLSPLPRARLHALHLCSPPFAPTPSLLPPHPPLLPPLQPGCSAATTLASAPSLKTTRVPSMSTRPPTPSSPRSRAPSSRRSWARCRCEHAQTLAPPTPLHTPLLTPALPAVSLPLSPRGHLPTVPPLHVCTHARMHTCRR